MIKTFFIKPISRSHREMFALFILLVIMGVVNYIMSSDNPLRFDDYIYQFFCRDIDGLDDASQLYDINNRIDSFSEAFHSQCNHYMHHNGRFVLHFIVQSFCGFLGKPLFSVFNAIMYMLFLYGCLHLLEVKGFYHAALVVGLLWFILPVQSIFTMSIAFAVNYLWVSTLVVWFLIIIRNSNRMQHLKSSSIICLFFVSLLVGATHEGFTLPLAGGLFIYLLCNYRIVKRQEYIMFIGVLFGALLVVFAPSTINRATTVMPSADQGEGSVWAQKMQVLFYAKRFLLMIIVICTGYVFIGKQKMNVLLKERIVWLSTIILDLFLVLSLSHYSQRMVFPLELLSVLVVLIILQELPVWDLIKSYAWVPVMLLMCWHIPSTLYYSRLVTEEYNQIVEQCRQSPEGKARYYDMSIPKYVAPYVERFRLPFEAEMLSIVLEKKVGVE